MPEFKSHDVNEISSRATNRSRADDSGEKLTVFDQDLEKHDVVARKKYFCVAGRNPLVGTIVLFIGMS